MSVANYISVCLQSSEMRINELRYNKEKGDTVYEVHFFNIKLFGGDKTCINHDI